MKITRVHLENFAQHRHVDCNITEDIVGVLGKNGSGKSNFASSIAMAVSGEFGKKKKKDLITHGQTHGFIHVEGVIKQNQFSVTRSLHDNECVLNYKDERFDGADIVNEKLLEAMGCDKAFLPNMVFVSQQDILGVLFGRPAERDKMLQKFFGLDKASKIEVSLGQWKSNLSYPLLVDKQQANEAIQRLEKQLRESHERVAKIDLDIAESTEFLSGVSLEVVQNNYDRALEREGLIDDIEALEQNIKDIKEKLKNLKEPDVSEEKLNEINDRVFELRENVAANTQIIELLSLANKSHCDGAEQQCPVCESAMSERSSELIQERLVEANKRKTKYQKELQSLQKSATEHESAWQAYRKTRDGFSGTVSVSEKRLAQLKKKLSTEEFPKKSSSDYMGGIRLIEKTQSELEFLNETRKTMLDNIAEIESNIAEHIKNLQKADATETKHRAIKLHESRISRIRDVFRYDGVSGHYVNNKMREMCNTINQYLGSFGAEYRVSVAHGSNEFICDFGSKKRPASDLSCGQKVALSLAFRFASCEMFSTGVDLVVLDEPTTWLDRETISNFKDIIESISELSQTKNLQVLMVTHERSLMPYFKQTIEF